MARYDEALADFSRAVALDPSNASVAAERGMTYREMSRYDEALADFSRAIELDPSNAFSSRRTRYDLPGDEPLRRGAGRLQPRHRVGSQ